MLALKYRDAITTTGKADAAHRQGILRFTQDHDRRETENSPTKIASSAMSQDWTSGHKGGALLDVACPLDEVQDLRITALCFNPILQSASNHRHSPHDTCQVNPLLEGTAAFDVMLRACHDTGMRVVSDGVFNHASRGFYPFYDVLENGEGSAYRDWFRIRHDPFSAYAHNQLSGYDAWVGLHALPNLNMDDPEVRESIMQVGEHPARKRIGRWRLDVPFEIRTKGFWAELSSRIKAIDPEVGIVGEVSATAAIGESATSSTRR